MSTMNANFSTTAMPVVVGPQSIEKRYPASEAQLEVWLSSQQSPQANCAYNEISSLVFRGDLDVQRLKDSIDRVVTRHESLRCTFSDDGQQVLIHGAIKYPFEQVDFYSETPEGIKQKTTSVIKDEATKPFDLVDGPLLRFVLQRLSQDQHKLTVTAHHLVMDGWSLGVFCKNLGHYYDLR